MKFTEFGLSSQLEYAIKDMGFENASPIQEQSIPVLLQGNDVIARAQTGTGKTASFGIPLIERIEGNGELEALVLVPTRELAKQVCEELEKLAKHRHNISVLPVYGGADMRRQIKALKKG